MKEVIFTNEVTKETKVVPIPEHLFLINKLLEELTTTEDFLNVYGDEGSIWNQGYEYLVDEFQKIAFYIFDIDNNEYNDYVIDFHRVTDESVSENVTMNAVLSVVTHVE